MTARAPLLHEFLVANRDEILARSRGKLQGRDVPTATDSELSNGLPLFLDQLVAILRAEKGDRTAGHLGVASSASLHGGELLRMGVTVGQVVQDYGSICQSVTELAAERAVAISSDEFQTFNRCLDDAIAQAVTEYQHQRDRTADGPGVAQLGSLAHEMRNLLATSMFTYEALARGNVGIHGSTGNLLGRSLKQMRGLIDRTLAEVRLSAGLQVPERVPIAQLIEEVELVATVEAKGREIRLSVDAGPYDLAVDADRQILTSVVANLVQNAVKFTKREGRITIRGHVAGDRVLIDVQDQCGGLPVGATENLFRPFKRQGADRTGLGLGLSISRQGARTCGGDIRVQDLPGVGCVFTVDLPRAAPTGA